MDLDDLRHALDEAALRHAPSDVSGARSVVGVRASRRRRRQRGFVSATMLAGAIVAIVIVLAIAGGGSSGRAPVVVTRPPASYESLPSREGAAMAYDAARGNVVLFGGEDLAGARADTWTWDGHGWNAMHPSVAPPARTGATMAYDPRTKAVLLFGGVTPRVHQTTLARDDLWSWNGTTWRRLHPRHEPPWGSGLAMSYDARSRSLILLTLPSSHPNLDLSPDGVGSRGDTPFGTWSWNGSDWRELPTPTAPLFAIGAVFHGSPRLAPLPHGAGLLLYSWAVYTGTCPPPGRCGGPPDPTGTLDSQTFTWDGTRWTREHPRRAPVDGQLLATTGGAPSVFTGDARWRWTGSDWAATPLTGPRPSGEGVAVVDDADHEVVAYSGRLGSDGAFFDTWTWDGSWVRREGPPDPLLATSTTVATIHACASSRLHLAMDRDLGSVMQQPGAFFSLTNVSSATCTLDGYPTVNLFDTAGRPVATQQSNGGSYLISDPGPHAVALQPGATAYFGFGWVDAYMAQGGTTKGCVAIGRASVVPPGSTRAVDAPVHWGEAFCPPQGFVTAIAPKRAWALTSSSP